MARTLITLPASAPRGSIIEIRTLIAHPMETGYRRDGDGSLLPRNILRRFECRYNGELVFSTDLFAAIAANPYLAFPLRVGDSGTLSFSWAGDQGFAQTETVMLTAT
ncbi:thiosulfate oxidation carrier complex protein SoxZ [Paucibacter sp. O1-1]|nr:thiosulfate oxidation carrier complex protein SoxZ [Paucibacter sp. O1-1]MDA3824803.1 thiosulfate oxidation carrier complex protein SoxZ [Paucibacter sp. O1-1]